MIEKKLENSREDSVSLPDSERQPCEIWTRVMGYFRPKFNFNRGKKSEFEERKYFCESKAKEKLDQPFVNDFESIKND